MSDKPPRFYGDWITKEDKERSDRIFAENRKRHWDQVGFLLFLEDRIAQEITWGEHMMMCKKEFVNVVDLNEGTVLNLAEIRKRKATDGGMDGTKKNWLQDLEMYTRFVTRPKGTTNVPMKEFSVMAREGSVTLLLDELDSGPNPCTWWMTQEFSDNMDCIEILPTDESDVAPDNVE